MTTLQDLLKNNKLIKYNIRANTDNFHRTNESIAILAAATSNRIIKIDKNIFNHKTKQEQINIAKKYMKQHFNKFNGSLPIFGKITSYSFFIDEEIIINIKDLNERL